MSIRTSGMAVIACLVLSACGSDSSGVSSALGLLDGADTVNSGSDSTAFDDSTSGEPRGVTNFAISGFVGTSVYSDRFEWIANVTNTGELPGELPIGGLLYESTTPDFSSGSAIAYYSVQRADGGEERELQPGESVEVTGFNTVAGVSRLVGGFLWTDSYVRFEMNPDYGLVTFANPTDGGGRYESGYAQEEERYDDNITETIQVRKEEYRSRRCEIDPYEENDTLNTAEPILLNTKYETTLCEDSFDVYDIELSAGMTYEVIPEGFDFEHGLTQRLIIIDPENNYVVDKTGVSGVFRATDSGTYSLVITSPFGSDHERWNEGTFEIIER